MNCYPCVLCPVSDVVNTDRRFLFFHLKNKHLFRDVVSKSIELGIIQNQYRESKSSVINSLIDRTKFGGMF